MKINEQKGKSVFSIYIPIDSASCNKLKALGGIPDHF